MRGIRILPSGYESRGGPPGNGESRHVGLVLNTKCTLSPAETFQQFLVTLEQSSSPLSEVIIPTDPFNFGFQSIDDQGVDTRSLHTSYCFRIIGEVVWKTDSCLLSHATTISRYRKGKSRIRDTRALTEIISRNACGVESPV